MTDRSADHVCRPLAWVFGLALLALWSCGSPEERYKTLSFFFDGVPLPDSMRETVEGPDGARVALVVVTHEPFEAERCSDCHGEVKQFSMSLAGYSGVKSSVCLKCHEGAPREYQAMHGPVAAIECLACHEAHESRYDHLLTAPSPQLCLKCHVGADVQASGAPHHQDLAADCLTCHHGHGGHDPYFLRINLTPPEPPETPASDPATQQPTVQDSEDEARPVEGTEGEAGP